MCCILSQPIERLLVWIQKTTGLVPHAIMSDCALSICNAISTMYAYLAGQGPKHYWCWFHVLKVFKCQAVTHLHKQSSKAITKFQTIMHSSLDSPVNITTFLLKWDQINPAFANNVRTQWMVNLKHWPCYYHTVRTHVCTRNDSTVTDCVFNWLFFRQHTMVSTLTTTPSHSMALSAQITVHPTSQKETHRQVPTDLNQRSGTLLSNSF